MPALDITSSSSSRLSSPESGASRPSSYYECESIEDVVNRIQTYNRTVRDMIVGSLGEIDDATVINQGTSELRQPQLTFHSIHGTNVSLQKSGRLARRHESFCKGLAFSNRPIGIDENVCIKQCEVATNWSGVLRFGLTNIDPETYRNTQVPKFACPDLSSKEGYWAKALPERYSVEGNILHFYVNAEGELYYGINGQQKGLFLMGINTTLPLWVIVDIYGNSTAVEFIDAAEHRTSRRPRTSSTIAPPLIVPPRPRTPPSTSTLPAHESHTNGDLTSATSPSITFHRVVGRHITLSNMRTVACRSEDEYSHGYVFTDRPVANNEKITIQITKVLDLYTGGLAVGLTCQDPATLRGVELPADSSDLVNFPDMYVGIKDVANKPPLGTKMSFWVSDKAELKIQIDDRPARTLIYVDNSLQLYFYFDVYGSTQAIKLIGSAPISRSRSPHTPIASSSRLSETMMPTHVALPPRPTAIDREASESNGLARNFNASITLDSGGTVSIRPPLPSRRNGSGILDLLTGNINEDDMPSLPPPLTPSGSGLSYRGSSPALPTRPVPSLPPASMRRPPAPPPVSSIPPVTPRFTLSIPPPTEAPPARPRLPIVTPVSAPSPAPSATSSGTGNDVTDEAEECTVCMAAAINSVIYTCGHMCMCYECALQTKELGRGCPICRKPMQDVIRTFKT